MIDLRRCLIIAASIIMFLTFQSQARVYVCEKNKDGPEITATQLSMESYDSLKTMVRDALDNADDIRIRHAVNDEYNWDICLKPDFWHKGGAGPSSEQHLTAYVYKENVFKTTCHIFSGKTKRDGPYNTTYP